MYLKEINQQYGVIHMCFKKIIIIAILIELIAIDGGIAWFLNSRISCVSKKLKFDKGNSKLFRNKE